MQKFEHLFEIAVSVGPDGNLKMRIEKDDDLVLTKTRTGIGTVPYEFELGTSEFEDHEKVLRKQRKAIKTLLKDKLLARKMKVKI